MSRAVAWIAVPVLSLLFLFPPARSEDTIHLRNGAELRGEILKRKPDQIIIDLGFTVLVVPADRVERISSSEATVTAAESGDLYRGDPGLEALTVDENVLRCGEAVLEVRTPVALGSGFVIHPEGYVITNHHVIAGEHELSLTLFAKGERDLARVSFDRVRIVATDPYADLALLKIEDLGERELTTLPLGLSSDLRQGETVFSIGSPLGFDRTVSQGIVSLRNRLMDGRLLIQSTTQLNPGNSGGPLLNLRGEVVGVNNMKIGGIGIEGMSFSVPVEAVKHFLRNRDAYAFDARNPNAGFRYLRPPRPEPPPDGGQE